MKSDFNDNNDDDDDDDDDDDEVVATVVVVVWPLGTHCALTPSPSLTVCLFLRVSHRPRFLHSLCHRSKNV